MVDRPLCMREVLGSIRRFSILFSFQIECVGSNVYKKEKNSIKISKCMINNQDKIQ